VTEPVLPTVVPSAIASLGYRRAQSPCGEAAPQESGAPFDHRTSSTVTFIGTPISSPDGFLSKDKLGSNALCVAVQGAAGSSTESLLGHSRTVRPQKKIWDFRPSTTPSAFWLVPPGAWTYWMFGRRYTPRTAFRGRTFPCRAFRAPPACRCRQIGPTVRSECKVLLDASQPLARTAQRR
jgi:hypothetical protein